MYDRAMILEKGRAAKTNFPMAHYEKEVAAYQRHCAERCASAVPSPKRPFEVHLPGLQQQLCHPSFKLVNGRICNIILQESALQEYNVCKLVV